MNRLFIRTLTLTAIFLAILGALYLYQISLVSIHKTPKPSPSSLPSTSSVQSTVEVIGPGGCKGIDDCLAYCQDHPQECAKPSQK